MKKENSFLDFIIHGKSLAYSRKIVYIWGAFGIASTGGEEW